MELGPSELSADDEDDACMLETAFVLEQASWSYDEQGRLAGSKWRDADCTEESRGEDSLTYSQGAVEVVERGEDGEYTFRYVVDTCGLVLGNDSEHLPTRFSYDERGRYLGWERGDENSEWIYTNEIAVDSRGTPWAVEKNAAERTLRLTPNEDMAASVTIQLDERSRVVSVQSPLETWTLTYDSCPNASLASTQWRLGDVFVAWPYPERPFTGEAAWSLDYWRHSVLPLQAEVL